MRGISTLFICLYTCLAAYAGEAGSALWNGGWLFCKGDSPQYCEPSFDDTAWRTLDLPHDWGVEEPFLQSNPGETGKLEWWGTAWYRKHFTTDFPEFTGRGEFLTAGIKSPRYFIDFGGIMAGASVYVNGVKVGERPYGYSSFRVEISPYLRDGDNVVAVRVDNKPESSRWYPGAGIYRNVYLVKTAASGVAHWGTYVSVEDIAENGTATLRVVTTLRGSGPLEVTSSIPLEGSPIFGSAPEAMEKKTTVQSDGDAAVVEQTFRIPKAVLWSPSEPNMQMLTTTVRNTDTGEVEKYFTPFGIRTIKWLPDGFYLNGERLFLKGVCLHHDSGALGAVWNEAVWERRLEQLGEMGCNAIRCTHNPPAPELLDLCDKMGFVVIDELTDTWTVAKTPGGYATLFEDWAERDLVDMIHRDRNHPCVVLWSIGNECAEQGYKDKWDIPRSLTDICHREDPTRPTTAGNDNPWASTQDYRHTIDVYGFNYKPHLYKEFHEANPEKPYYGSETASCISSRGFYLFPVSNEKGEGWPEGAPYQVSSYDLYAPYWASCPDHEWKYEDENPSCAGEFVWTGFDYIGEPTPYNFDLTVLTNAHSEAELEAARRDLEELSRKAPPSRSSYFGIFDLAGFPKDRYWLYKARWRPQEPVAHILPHWNWPDREGLVTPVHVYTSGDSGELFINGKSQGVRIRSEKEYRLRWDDVVYQKGEVTVVTWKDGKPWARDTVRTTGAPAALEVETHSRGGLIFVTAKVVDENGFVVPDACPELTFSVSSPGELLCTDAGDPTSHVSFSSPTLPAFAGLCSAIVKAPHRMPDRKPGMHIKPPRPISITVSSPGLEPVTVKSGF